MVAMVVTAGLIDLAGVAGYRFGLVVVAVPLVAGSGLLVFRLLRGTASAIIWSLVAAVLGLVATALLGSRAPDSRGELARSLDALELPFFEVAGERQSGHSWCRPTCPVVERTYTVPDVGVQSSMVTIGLALQRAGLLTEADLRNLAGDAFLRVRSERVDVEVRIDEGDDGVITNVRIRYASHRR